jgi:ferredoxin--NADP+ reductase
MTPDEISDLRRRKYNATVLRLHKVHEDLLIMRVKPDFPRPAHKPGQYTVLGLGLWEPRHPGCQFESLAAGDETKLGRRSYSISCSVLDERGELPDIAQTDWLEFFITLVRESGKPQAPLLTPRLFMLNQGDRLIVGEKIAGHFTLDGVRPEDDVIFLGTGTGEAPHNYMLWELLRRGHKGRILAAFCVRFKKDLAYLAIHEQLMARYPNYTYVPLTTREDVPTTGKMYIQDLLLTGELERRLGAKLEPGRAHVYLCGNPKMIGIPERDQAAGQMVFPEAVGVIELLVKRGFTLEDPARKVRGEVHYEKYW